MAGKKKEKKTASKGIEGHQQGKLENASSGLAGSGAGSAFAAAANRANTVAEMMKETKLASPLKSVGMKLFLIIFVSILACVLTVGLMAYGEAKSIVEKKVSDASLQTVNQVAENLDIIYKTYEDITLQILVDKDFHTIVGDIASNADDYSRFEASRKLSDKIQAYAIGNSSIKGIMLLPVKEGLHIVASGSALSTSADALMKQAWFQQTIEFNGKVNWIAPQAEGLSMGPDQKSIGISRLLKDSVSSDASYVLLLEMEVGTFSDRYSEVSLGEGSEIAIVDGSGNYVVANDPARIGQPANVQLPAGEDGDFGATKLTTTNGLEVLAVYKSFEAMDWKLVGTIPVEMLVKDAEAIRTLTWITVAAAAVIAIAIGFLVLFSIATPLVRLRNLMVEGAGGNLTVRSSIRKRQDEIGGLSDSFNRMMTQITELAHQSTASAEQVLLTASDLTSASKKTSMSAREIAVATEEIAGGATSLAVEAERGNDLTSDMNTQMRRVIEANREMAASAAQVERASGQGTAYMGMLIEKTGLTEEMTRSMVEKVDKLKDSTGSIVKILDVLNNLTKQTNILSLNATIEAARAGAAGKGFMVVADEIRKLADQSRQSIDVVAQITAKIAGEIEETVHVLSDAYPIFQEQIGSVKEANGIFLTVQEQMGNFASRLEGVTSSIEELNQSQSVLAVAMTNVSAVAEEASATSEEVASLSSEQLAISESLVQLSEKLDAVSKGLKDSLSKFKI
ncbi:methyl-accepting chemotaxis protein [Paenibacillus sp. LHD-117]|uniref:methyl-accepting chemotaxis protein n=1 Tax=Paenibacillus sp. LHD-117 TaxID=3071412 RepID=UPI0027DEED1B|nr:methyl-accepting chemotaxis protein [Paenibacillus sp. LHD-117]MDQ6418564.1 methyl-accepting chemotaxis protein [Paenibacillus sp. LHD-117]